MKFIKVEDKYINVDQIVTVEPLPPNWAAHAIGHRTLLKCHREYISTSMPIEEVMEKLL